MDLLKIIFPCRFPVHFPVFLPHLWVIHTNHVVLSKLVPLHRRSVFGMFFLFLFCGFQPMTSDLSDAVHMHQTLLQRGHRISLTSKVNPVSSWSVSLVLWREQLNVLIICLLKNWCYLLFYVSFPPGHKALFIFIFPASSTLATTW